MARRAAESLPACYAMVAPGFEAVAEDEISRTLGGEIKRSGHGIVVFRLPEIDRSILRLRTTEDVFLLAWGTDQLTYRSDDLDRIQRWTDRDADWNRLLQIHHAIRPKPKGKPTFRVVTQMTGEHGYRRVDARKALMRGLTGKFPASWRLVEENAAIEFWLTIHGNTAVCGLRLSDRSMRHRTYKQEHLPASLRPTVAAGMVWLAAIRPQQIVADPMCGAGTILAELLAAVRMHDIPGVRVLGGDSDASAVRAARGNLARQGQLELLRWDATRLPMADHSLDAIISNPPFGKQMQPEINIGHFYRRMIKQYHRILKPGGKAVLLVSEFDALREATRPYAWKMVRMLRVRVLGQQAVISVWRRPDQS